MGWMGVQIQRRGIIPVAPVLPAVGALVCALCLAGCVSPGGQPELALSDFDFLEAGMGLEEIVERVGEPDRDVGSGVYLFHYDLADGRTVQLMFIDPDALAGAQVRGEDGTWIVIIEAR